MKSFAPLLLGLSLLFSATAFASPGKLRMDMRAARDEAGAISPEMGLQASLTFQLGEPAFFGRATGEHAVHSQQRSGRIEGWTLGTYASTWTAERVLFGGGPFVSFKRTLELHGPLGARTGATATTSYRPKAPSDHAFVSTTRESNLGFGIRLVTKSVVRQQFTKHDVFETTLKSSRTLAFGALKIRLPGGKR